MDRWANKVAVVTGASSGIGAEICRQLVKNLGMKVVGLARREDRLKELNQELDVQHKGMFHYVRCDVTKDEEVKSAFVWIDQTFGAISVMINNAGYLNMASLLDHDMSEVRKIFEINVFGLLSCTQQAVKNIVKHNVQGARIICINSISGNNLPSLAVNYGVTAYSASKNASRILVDGIRSELTKKKLKIGTTDIYPGLVETEMTAQFMTPDMDSSSALKPKDVARACIDVLKAPEYVQIAKIQIQPVNEDTL